MSTGLRVLSGILLVLPVGLLLAALGTVAPVRTVLLGVVVSIVLVYASVWFLWRPTRFEIDRDTLRIVWPMRTRSIPRRTIATARLLAGDGFRREYGYGMRIGAGGLWGGFGLLKTRTTTFSMWISRIDGLVLVTLRDARPLLVTPDDPARFVAALAGS